MASYGTTINGVAYPSQNAALKALGVSEAGSHKRRRRYGETFEEAVLAILSNKHRKKPVEFRGKVYPSLTQIAVDFGLSYDLLMARLKIGWDMERAVTEPVANCSPNKVSKHGSPIEYNGVWYESLSDLADAYGIVYDLFYKRVYNMGWTMERALTEKPIKKNIGKKRIELDGKVFETFKDASDYSGIDASALSKRYKRGIPLRFERKVIYERDGESFFTLREIGERFNCDPYALSHYITKCGLSYDEAIEKAVDLGRGNRETKDFDGDALFMGLTYNEVLAAFGLALRDVRYHFDDLDAYIGEVLLAGRDGFVALTDDGFVLALFSDVYMKLPLADFLKELRDTPAIL